MGDLTPQLAWLHRRLAEGDRLALDVLRDSRYSATLHAHLIRNLLLARLEKDRPLGLTYKELLTDGVEIARGRYRIRVLKARALEPDPRLYPAGANGARSRYFEQVPLLQVDMPVVHLVLSWSADLAGLNGVGLALPVGSGSWPGDAEVAWHVPLTLQRPVVGDVHDEEDLVFKVRLGDQEDGEQEVGEQDTGTDGWPGW